MKQIFKITLMLVMVVAMAACNSKKTEETPSPLVEQTEASREALKKIQTEPTVANAEAGVKVLVDCIKTLKTVKDDNEEASVLLDSSVDLFLACDEVLSQDSDAYDKASDVMSQFHGDLEATKVMKAIVKRAQGRQQQPNFDSPVTIAEP